MFVKKIIWICFASLVIANLSYASSPGTSGGRILNQAIGARPLSMGETFVAIADDINAINWNPAGLGNLERPTISTMYLKGLADTGYYYFGYGQPAGEIGAIAVSVFTLQGGNMEINYTDGTSATKKSEQDYVYSFSYARKLNKSISLGANIKFISSTLAEDYSTTAYAFDFGGLYKLADKLSLGLVVQNIGTKIKYEEEGDPLPMKIRGGIAYRIMPNQNHDLIIGMDIVKPNDDSLKEHLGMEYWFKKTIAIRTGYKIGYDLDSLTGGVGFKLKNCQIDYGIAMMGELDSTHRVSLTMGF